MRAQRTVVTAFHLSRAPMSGPQPKGVEQTFGDEFYELPATGKRNGSCLIDVAKEQEALSCILKSVGSYIAATTSSVASSRNRDPQNLSTSPSKSSFSSAAVCVPFSRA